MAALRGRLERDLLERCPGTKVNGAGEARVPNVSSLAFEGVTGEALVIALDLEGIAVSAGSACSAGTIRRSPSLLAMGLEDESRRSIRVSLGPETGDEEIAAFVGCLAQVLGPLRRATTEASVAGRR